MSVCRAGLLISIFAAFRSLRWAGERVVLLPSLSYNLPRCPGEPASGDTSTFKLRNRNSGANRTAREDSKARDRRLAKSLFLLELRTPGKTDCKVRRANWLTVSLGVRQGVSG